MTTPEEADAWINNDIGTPHEPSFKYVIDYHGDYKHYQMEAERDLINLRNADPKFGLQRE